MRPRAAAWPESGGMRQEQLKSRLRAFGVFLLALGVSVVGLLVYQKFDTIGLVGMTTILLFGGVFIIVSFRWPQIPLMAWLLSLLGFRTVFFMQTPGLPDLTVDRILIFWVMGVFVTKSVLEKGKAKPPFTLDWLLIAHAIYQLLSLMTVKSAGFNNWTQSTLMPYAGYFLGKYLVTDLKWMNRFFFLLLMMNVYNGITAIGEHFHWSFLVYPKFILNINIGQRVPGRSRGIFLQSAVFGTVVSQLLCIQLYFLITSKNLLHKGIVLFSLILALLGLFFCYTRGTWLAGIMAMLVIGVIGFRYYAGWLVRIGLAATLLLGLGFLNLKQDKFFMERMETEHTLTGRINNLMTSLRIWHDHPLFGCGYFNYMKIKAEYMEASDVPIFGVIKRSEGFESSIHDIYIGLLAEEGLVGTALVIAIYILIIQTFLKKYRLRRQGDYFAMYVMPAIAGLLVAYWVAGISFDYRYFTAMGGLFFFFAGILSGYEPTDEAPIYAAPKPEPPPRTLLPGSVIR